MTVLPTGVVTNGVPERAKELLRKHHPVVPKRERPRLAPFECVHLGPVKRREPESKCGCRSADGPIDVHHCQLFGEATVGPNGLTNPLLGDDVANCRRCTARREPKRKAVTIRVAWSPGDNVVATAALRELATQYPGWYDVTLRTHIPQLWENNPHVVAVEGATNSDDQFNGIKWHNLSIDRFISDGQWRPGHYLDGMAKDLSEALGLPRGLPITKFGGDIHLSDDEKHRNQVQDELGTKQRPWWLISAGGKGDCTVKVWPRSHFQAVVDHFKGRVLFVQVGGVSGDDGGHGHPALDDVLDLRGRTNHRDLASLVYHCDGVVSANSYLMHMAAAVERPHWKPGLLPAIVLGGGREAVQWYQYPAHTVLHRTAAMDCCWGGGCWKHRVVPLGDGRPYDKPAKLCSNPVEYHGRQEAACMVDIRPDEAIAAIESHLDGGRIALPVHGH